MQGLMVDEFWVSKEADFYKVIYMCHLHVLVCLLAFACFVHEHVAELIFQ